MTLPGIENQEPRHQGSGSTAVAPVQQQQQQQIEDGPSAVAAPAAPRPAPAPMNKLDPGIIDAILGKSDAQRMLECVRDLKSDQFSVDQKLNIWDELELVQDFRMSFNGVY